MIHPLAHAVPMFCCTVAAFYLANLIAVDVRAGILRLRSREAAEGFAYVLAATIAAGISAAPVLAWAIATGAAR